MPLRRAAARTRTTLSPSGMLLLLFAVGCHAQDSANKALMGPPPPKYNRAPGAIATHRFWAAKNWFPLNLTAEGGPYTMFAEPLALQTTPHGLLVGYSPTITIGKDYFVHPVQPDFTIGTRGLNASSVTIATQTDRMVDLDFGTLRTRVGRGMPFVYVETHGAEPTITFVAPPEVFKQEDNLLGVTTGRNTYAFFCPSHGTWTSSGKVFTCHPPPGHNYLSAALLPNAAAFDAFKHVAFVFPVDTQTSWAYDEQRSSVSTTFTVQTELKEGTDTGFVQALYPHQYGSLLGTTASATETYASARGTLRLLTAKSFTTVDTFHGVLPFLPVPKSFDVATERGLLRRVSLEHDLFPVPDTYGQGKAMGRVAQLLPLAQMSAEPLVLSRLSNALREQFALWSAPGDRNQRHFVYDGAWGTLVGYPASYGSNAQLNDHHFHYGYWINAAAMLGLYDAAWLARRENAAFIAGLAEDIANIDPHNEAYPVLRSFDPYSGHSWASGQAPFGDGGNEESSSEAVNAWAGLILFATETGSQPLRDAAIWMYTLEANSAFDYWFNDGPVHTFPAGFDRTQVANLFDGKADTATWFGNAPEFEHGIEFLPFTGASLYLGRDPAYVRRNLTEVTRATGGGIQTGGTNWPDLMEMYQAFYDPREALAQWSKTGYTFDGETRAHEFAWLSTLAAYGRVDQEITADTPFYAVFRADSGTRTHIAFNPGAATIIVKFSDGAVLDIPPYSMNTEGRLLNIRSK